MPIPGPYVKDETRLILKESARSFHRDNCIVFSAALAFYAMFAAIPILLLAVLAIGRMLASSQEAIEALQHLVSTLLPGKQQIIFDEVYSLSRLKVFISTVGIITCLWSIVPLVSALKVVFSSIFRVKGNRSFIYEVALDVSSSLLLILILIFLVIGEIAYSQITARLIKEIPYLLHLVNHLTNLTIAFVSVALFYYVFIPVRLKFRHIATVSGLISIIWVLIRPIMAFFITSNPQFGIVFGSLKALFLIFMWIYLSFFLILMGVEILANLSRKDTVIVRELITGGTKNQREHLSLVKRYAVSYDCGNTVFEGDCRGKVYYVISGSVRLFKGEKEVEVASKGEFFGVASWLMEMPEADSAIAVDDDTQILPIAEKDFTDFIKLQPDVNLSLLRQMATKLYRVNQ